MRILIISDSHDNAQPVRSAIRYAQEHGIAQGIHLGDYCNANIVDELGASPLRWTGVWGNMDLESHELRSAVDRYENVDVADTDYREMNIEGLTLMLTHYPEIARISALSGQYDASFHGHTHVASQSMVKANNGREVLLANPGEVSGENYGKATFGIFDTESKSFGVVKANKPEVS